MSGENGGELGERLTGGRRWKGVGVRVVVGGKMSVRFMGGCCVCPSMVIGENEGELGENVGELGEKVIGDGVGRLVGVEMVEGVSGEIVDGVGGSDSDVDR